MTIRMMIIAAGLLVANTASAGSIQFFGPNGEYNGVAMPVGPNSVQYFDSNGNYRGNAVGVGGNIGEVGVIPAVPNVNVPVNIEPMFR